jgi:uncharacterized protein (DUF58 family)
VFARSSPPLAVARGNLNGDLRRLVRNLWLIAAVIMLIAGAALRQRIPAVAGALVLLTGTVAMTWSRLALVGLAYERRWSAQRAFVGDDLEVTFTLRNPKALPLPWLEVSELVADRLVPAGMRLVPAARQGSLYYRHTTSLSWYERVSWRQRFSCTARGYFQMGPAILRSSDVFGFFPRQVEYAARDSIVVMPRLVDLGGVSLPARRPFGDARQGSPIFEDQSRIAGLRDYQAGDALKRIDWKATARHDRLQSRLYEPAATTALIVALNVDTFSHSWEGYDPLLLERAVSVAASMATLADTQRIATGLITNCSYPGADRPMVVSPGRDPAQLARIFSALAMVSSFTIVALDELLARERRLIPATASVALVAGFMAPLLAQRLERLQRDGVAVAVYWVSDAPFEYPFPGLVLHELGERLRAFERTDPLAYGAETGAAAPLVRRAI